MYVISLASKLLKEPLKLVRPFSRISLNPTDFTNRMSIAPPCRHIDSPAFQSIVTPELRQLADMFKQYNFELRIAGGAVRDLLMGMTPHDIDFATTATPDQMKEMFARENIRLINSRGESHGTITARIDDKENFEVTTLRIDRETDGRHATVEFTTDWYVDASRRDLTINSLFLDLDAGLYDFFNGEEDIKARHVRFVNDPVDRIQEDYLRILRYFRFVGRMGSSIYDANTLKAISENATGLDSISGERLWTELKKILVGPLAPDVVCRMKETNCLVHLGIKDQPNLKQLEEVWLRSRSLNPNPATILASLVTSQEEILNILNRLKISNEELAILTFIAHSGASLFSGDNSPPIDSFKARFFAPKPGNASLKTIAEGLKYLGREKDLAEFETWKPPKFPVRGDNLGKLWGIRGRDVGLAIDQLKGIWVQSGYQTTETELLSEEMKQIVVTQKRKTLEDDVDVVGKKGKLNSD